MINNQLHMKETEKCLWGSPGRLGTQQTWLRPHMQAAPLWMQKAMCYVSWKPFAGLSSPNSLHRTCPLGRPQWSQRGSQAGEGLPSLGTWMWILTLARSSRTPALHWALF